MSKHPLTLTRHATQRIHERAAIDPDQVVDSIPADIRAQVEAGERLVTWQAAKIRLVCDRGCVITVLDHNTSRQHSVNLPYRHANRRQEFEAAADDPMMFRTGRPASGRPRRAVLDDEVELCVGGRAMKIRAEDMV